MDLTTAQVGGVIVSEYWSDSTGSITAAADGGGGQVIITSVAHGIREGQGVTITGTTSYNGRVIATNVTDDTFEITDTIVATETGTWALEWTKFNTMNSLSSGTYARRGNELFSSTPGSYQVRYNPFIDDDWAKVEPDAGMGSLYWVRFRITSNLTTAPIFEQWKLHSSRTELNGDGYQEGMANARAYVGFPVNWSNFKDATAGIGNQDLFLSANSLVGMGNNNFNDDGDNVGTFLTIPPWVDTSAPMKFFVIVVPETSGDLTMTAFVNSTTDGDTISTTAVGATTGEISEAVTQTVVAGEQITFNFNLDISDRGVEDGIIQEVLWVNIGATTRPGNVYGMVFQIGFLNWRVGRHISSF